MTIQAAFQYAQTQGLERLDAQMLLLHALGRSLHDRAWIALHISDTLDPTTAKTFKDFVQRRLIGEPVAYITGQKEFYGLTLQVDHRVLVPRPDTETLVDWALELIPPLSQAHVIDLGTGSGAIALALKHSRPDWHVHAIDFSADALAVAQANASVLHLNIQFSQGAWLKGITDRFHAIVSNPPYIADADPHLAALQHEPLQALTSGSDGLDDIRIIIQQATTHLLDGGWLLIEHGYDQAADVRQLLYEAGFQKVQSRRDLASIERCTAGCWQGNTAK